MQDKLPPDAGLDVNQTRVNFVALSEVARLAYVIAYERSPDPGDASRIAALLARETQIYTPDENGLGLRPVTQAELLDGHFSEDARSLNFKDGRGSVQPLVLAQTAAGLAVDALKRAAGRSRE